MRNETTQQRVDREERERIEKSNKKRELDRQKLYVSQLDLDLHQTRERIGELRKEINELENQAVTRERKLNSAKTKLVMMECGQ